MQGLNPAFLGGASVLCGLVWTRASGCCPVLAERTKGPVCDQVLIAGAEPRFP